MCTCAEESGPALRKTLSQLDCSLEADLSYARVHPILCPYPLASPQGRGEGLEIDFNPTVKNVINHDEASMKT